MALLADKQLVTRGQLNEKHKKKILVLSEWFAPGFLAGGPIQSCVNFVENLAEQYHIVVFTSNRDFGLKEPYPGIPSNQLVPFGEKHKSQVYYAQPGFQLILNFYRQIRTVKPDFVYLNSMYSFRFTQIPLLFLWLTSYKGKIILAPRGMLHAGALQYKSLKKKIFLSMVKWSGLANRIIFQATDEQEARDIKKWLNANHIVILSNFPQNRQLPLRQRNKKAGLLDLVYVSRVAPKKNLLFLLEILKKIKGKIHLTIIGPIEDPVYWAKCQKTIEELPTSHTVVSSGQIKHDEIGKHLQEFHFFVLPTFGENFGHAIFEAFLAGCPVIISDQTPWKDLESQKAGFDIPLDQPEKFVKAISFALNMDQKEYDQWSEGAWQLAKKFLEFSTLQEKYQNLFS